MKVVLLSAVLVGMGNAQQPERDTQDRSNTKPAVSAGLGLDGTWTIVYGEENGRRVDLGKDATVTIQGNTFTCKGGDANKQAMRFEFGPNNSVRVAADTGTRPATGNDRADEGGVKGRNELGNVAPQTTATQGVYIPSQEFLCIAVGTTGMTPGRDISTDRPGADRPGTPGTAA